MVVPICDDFGIDDIEICAGILHDDGSFAATEAHILGWRASDLGVVELEFASAARNQ